MTTKDLGTMPTRHLPPGYERVSADYRGAHALRAWLAQAQKRGEIEVVPPLYRTLDGGLHATYRRIKPDRRVPVLRLRTWVRCTLAAIGIGVVVGIGYAIKRLVDGIANAVTHPSSAAIGLLIMAGLVLLLLAFARRSSGRTFTFSGRGRFD